MLDPIREVKDGFYVAWRSKRKFQAGRYDDKIMDHDQAEREAEKLASEHPENTYWAEHIPKKFAPH